MFTALVLVGCSSPAATLCFAEPLRFGDETFELFGGAILQNYDTTIDVKDRATGIGSSVNLEKTLGYDEDDTPWIVGASLRFAERHRLSITYFESNRNVTAIAKEDIDIGEGEIIPVGAGYASSLDFKVIPITYSYSFIKNDNHEFYGSLGLHWNSVNYDALGVTGLGEDTWEGSVVAEADAPMPLIGIGYDYYISDRWKVSASAQAFYIKLSDDTFSFEGGIVNVDLSTVYYIFDNVGIGAGINYFELNVDVDDSDWLGSLEYSYWGPSASLRIRF
jgi:outer membrane scaffolding protein for murein synthesis (MipA/OmpV family)